jgi:UDP-N-acetylglucosamine 3-dehydrogenase
MFDGVRGGALRAEFDRISPIVRSKGITPSIGTPEDAAAALEATLAAEESARTGERHSGSDRREHGRQEA